MINFLEKDISEEENSNFEKNEFAFFIAEDEGIALGYGPSTYRSYSNEFFGISGTFFLNKGYDDLPNIDDFAMLFDKRGCTS
ncbi:hypothetical protein [Legionella sp. WA2022007384]